MSLPTSDGASDEAFFLATYQVDADGFLELKNQPGADRLDDGRGAAFFAMFNVGQVAVGDRIHIRDCAAPDYGRDGVLEQLTPSHQYPGSSGPPNQFVRGEDYRIKVRGPVTGAVHVDGHVGSCRGEVPK